MKISMIHDERKMMMMININTCTRMTDVLQYLIQFCDTWETQIVL